MIDGLLKISVSHVLWQRIKRILVTDHVVFTSFFVSSGWIIQIHFVSGCIPLALGMKAIYYNPFLATWLVTAILAAVNESRTWEEMIPCRDGTLLHTRIALPRNSKEATYTTVVDRSPYGYSDLEWMSNFYLPAGFAAIGQDFRGTHKSEGLFSIWHKDANDSEDLGDWIVQQPWSNGLVYTFGASADGLGAFTTVQNEPKWLGAQYFIWASSIGYDVFFPGGAMMFDLISSWIHHTVNGSWADVCYEEIIKNEMKTDWWTPVELTHHYDRIHAPAAFWAGWYDLFLVGNLAAYKGYNYESDPSVRNTAKIMVDPLGHCQDAAQWFPQDLVEGRSLLAFMQSYEVFGIRPIQRTSIENVTFYVMSSNDEAGLSTANFWTSQDSFPIPKMTHYYAHADGTASMAKPNESEDAFTSYVYDPSNPVPTVGGSNLHPPCGPLDQVDIDKRSDVLLFQTPVQDKALFMTGPLFANLFVGSDAVDTDFMVRISDVYPTGEVRLIQDSAVRMRWREGGLTPVMMKPNEVYEVTASLWNTSYAIAPGHALRFAVTSSNYPRFSANPNNGLLLVQNGTENVPVVANNIFYHSSQYPSSFVLPVVQKHQLPELHDIKLQFQKAYPHIDVDKLLEAHPDIFNEMVQSRKLGAKQAQLNKPHLV